MVDGDILTMRSAGGARTNGEVRMPPLVVHVIYALEHGGMEQVLLKLVNQTQGMHYRQDAIVCMADATDALIRQVRTDVSRHPLEKATRTRPAYAR